MLKIPKDVLDTLHVMRQWNLAESSDNAFVVENPVVILTLGLGDEIYLGLDGRVFVLPFMDQVAGVQTIQETNDPRTAAAGLLIAARRRDLPELLALLPPRPAGAIDCEPCQRRRWIEVPGFPHQFICSECG